jgi:hypothetical protein
MSDTKDTQTTPAIERRKAAAVEAAYILEAVRK